MSTSHRDRAVEAQEVICGACQTSNPIARRFCGRCGQRLWEPCNDCRTPNARDLQFCGHCGVDLQQALERRLSEIKAKLARFEAMRQEARYLEARAALNAIEDTGDTRLVPLLNEIQAKLEGLADERAARTEQSLRQFEAAQQALGESNYSRAWQLLQQIPAGLRDQPIKEALETASTAVQEINSLAERIKASLRIQALDGLLPHVNRLLELRPGDEKLLKLAKQLEQRQQQHNNHTAHQSLAMAQKLLQERRYLQAAKALTAISEDDVAPNQRRLYDTVMELDELLRTLKQEPYLQRQLLGVAQRWQKLSPQDADANRIVEQLRKRLAAIPNDVHFPPLWTKPPERTA